MFGYLLSLILSLLIWYLCYFWILNLWVPGLVLACASFFGSSQKGKSAHGRTKPAVSFLSDFDCLLSSGFLFASLSLSISLAPPLSPSLCLLFYLGGSPSALYLGGSPSMFFFSQALGKRKPFVVCVSPCDWKFRARSSSIGPTSRSPVRAGVFFFAVVVF